MPKKRHYKWESETDLAAQVVRYLRERKWTVYQEVDGIDIVAVKNNRRWAIECKRHWNLTIMAQTWDARKKVHGCSMAVPAIFAGRDHHFCLAAAKSMGFGIITVSRPNASRRSTINERVKPAWQEHCDDSLDHWLVERAEDHSQAGSASAAAWTPFKQTCHLLEELLKQQGEQILSQAIRAIDHHYSSHSSARSQLIKLINEGALSQFELHGSGRDCRISLTNLG